MANKDTQKSFDQLINEINETAGDIQRERGTLFEKLVVAYLKNEPIYKNLFTDVWMLNDVPEEFQISSKDTGVDIVARDTKGQLTAIQAKFYSGKVAKAQIDSFIAELGKKQYDKGMIVSTVDDWNQNAQSTIDEQTKDVQIIGLADLRNSQIDWSSFDFKHSEEVKTKAPKKIRSYQKDAIAKTVDYFTDHDRGQLIMAPGTGKTFTSLKLTEQLTKNANQNQFRVLYLVPSIQLLTQTLRGWNNDIDDSLSIENMAVTSDRNASRGKKESNEDIKPDDIGFPATTSTKQIIKNWHSIQENQLKDILVVFSTYQSIDVISDAQKEGFPEFDLIIADEAHKTTGAKALGTDFSAFTKVHDNNIVAGKKRLYQTATPKIYGPEAKKKAIEQSIVVSSMDDTSKYGDVIYRLGFGDAVSHDILTDYKLMVLAVDEKTIQRDMQGVLSDPENGLNIDDVGRILGVWNAMMKRHGTPRPNMYDGSPMRRAIAFTSVIDSDKSRRGANGMGSKQFARDFPNVINEYLGDDINEHMNVNVRHADGSMNALQKNDVLSWLADSNMPDDEARIVSNVKFLTEGIDVPTLDAVIFLAPKKSQVDIVQAIGRIMRKAPGKDYGYIILPVVVPAGVDPESILNNNKQYDVIWQVMNALRSVDERFEATVNKLQLNKKKPQQISVVGVNGKPKGGNKIGNAHSTDDDGDDFVDVNDPVQQELNLDWENMKEAIYGKIVEKVGDRKYLEDWSNDVSAIAQRYIDWINLKLKDEDSDLAIEFNNYVQSLKHNINDGIDQQQAIEMLAQHLITKPVFEALFSEYSFVNNNPVSQAMESILSQLERYGFSKETQQLEPFYESVRMRAEGIDNAEAKQQIIITLYDKFFSKAFKSTTERLGIVFTPTEVVDFIVKSVDDVLNKHFGKSLADKGVHILDPFTGTGTFIVRTLTYLKEQMQEGKITLADITHKFTQELHANEIVLLSYYIAAINIESTFDDVNGDDEGYVPFEGIVLTDTFESTENQDTLDDSYFGTNDARLKKQLADRITVVIGNPPYSAKQQSVNDDNANGKYPKLDKRISETYAAGSQAGNKNNLYDSYIRALRWASDKIQETGVIGFVSGAGFIDGRSSEGVRSSLYSEFNHLYIFNLRGNQRTKGETSKKEGGKIFGGGSRSPIAISILVKDGSDNHEIHYHDIGDYLSREEKLLILSQNQSISNINWNEIIPDQHNDWINQRDERYDSYNSISDKETSFFKSRGSGLSTARDPWLISFTKSDALKNSKKLVDGFNKQVDEISDEKKLNKNKSESSWSDTLLKKWRKKQKISFDDSSLEYIMYRPFTKKWFNNLRPVIERPRFWNEIFGSEKKEKNLFINWGSGTNFGALATNCITEYQFVHNNKTIPLYTFDNGTLFDSIESNISDFVQKDFQGDDAFYYVYAVLHSPKYNALYQNDLAKVLPNIPILKGKEEYVRIGEELVNVHINYENQPIWPGVNVNYNIKNPSYIVKKMVHPDNQINTIRYNSDITVANIPEEAYDYVVNGSPAIEWIIDQYQYKKNGTTGFVDDPNGFSDDPKYILNLLLSVITVSMKTNELVKQLPEFEVIEEN